MSSNNGRPMIPPGFPGGGTSRPAQQPQGVLVAQPLNDMQLIELMAGHIYAGHDTHLMPDGSATPMTPQIAAGVACAVFAECRVLVMEQHVIDAMVENIKRREGLLGPSPDQDEAEEAKRKARREAETGPTLVTGENGV